VDGCQQESQGGPRRTQLRSGCTLGGGTSGLPWVGAKGSVGNDGMAVCANPMTHGYDVYTLNGQDVARCLVGGNVLFLETVSDGSGGCYDMTYPGMEYSGDVSDGVSEWMWGKNLFLETFSKVLFLETFCWYFLECAYGVQMLGPHCSGVGKLGGSTGRCGPAEMDFGAKADDEWTCPYLEYTDPSCFGTKDGWQDGVRYLPAMRESSGSEGKWATD